VIGSNTLSGWTPRRGPAEGGQKPPGVAEVGQAAGAERHVDVAARHGNDPGEHAPARLVDGARTILWGTMKLLSATVIASPFPWPEGLL